MTAHQLNKVIVLAENALKSFRNLFAIYGDWGLVANGQYIKLSVLLKD
jgi:hypothetical protein